MKIGVLVLPRVGCMYSPPSQISDCDRELGGDSLLVLNVELRLELSELAPVFASRFWLSEKDRVCLLLPPALTALRAPAPAPAFEILRLIARPELFPASLIFRLKDAPNAHCRPRSSIVVGLGGLSPTVCDSYVPPRATRFVFLGSWLKLFVLRSPFTFAVAGYMRSRF